MARSSSPSNGHGRSFRRNAIGWAAFALREVAATTRVALAARTGWRGHARAGAHSRDDVVVFVHGLMATAGAFGPMLRHLGSELGVDVHTFTHLPGASLDEIAERTHRCLVEHPGAHRVHLVGHSLGGLAVRWYVQERTHDPRVVQTISIASPFLGIDVADLFPDRLREIVLPPNEQLARIVERAPQHLSRVPHLSIIAERDQLVSPATRGILPGAPSFVLHDTGHNGALFHGKVHGAIVREIAKRIPSEELGG
jgi:pimeloyl-ACP methyl ester carboxylesterase